MIQRSPGTPTGKFVSVNSNGWKVNLEIFLRRLSANGLGMRRTWYSVKVGSKGMAFARIEKRAKLWEVHRRENLVGRFKTKDQALESVHIAAQDNALKDPDRFLWENGLLRAAN